jgi:hypothetical protein
MENVIDVSTRREKGRKRGWLVRLAITLGPALALLIYFLLLEQYGFLFLDSDSDEPIIEAAP